MCLCETKCQEGGIAPFWGATHLPEKVSRDMGYRSDSIAISRDMGPLRSHRSTPGFLAIQTRSQILAFSLGLDLMTCTQIRYASSTCGVMLPATGGLSWSIGSLRALIMLQDYVS